MNSAGSLAAFVGASGQASGAVLPKSLQRDIVPFDHGIDRRPRIAREERARFKLLDACRGR